MSKNKIFLEASAKKYHSKIIKGWESLYQKKRYNLYNVFKKSFCGRRALELGCADGIMTQWLSEDFKTVTVVEGSEIFLKEVKEKAKLRNVDFVHSMFENYVSVNKFDAIFMSHILEHMERPVLILKKFKKYLTPRGKIFIAVPNANSLHRLAGVKMGLLQKENSLNEQDVILGHKRVYTPQLLRDHIQRAGYKIKKFGGVMLKPISNCQMEGGWSAELIDAFFKLGEDFPELCSELYAVITPKL